MNTRKILLTGIFMAVLAILGSGSQVLAGNPPPQDPTIGGPEYWGVVVINCNDGTVTLRAKRVVDCIVETQALIEDYGSPGICLNGQLTENEMLNQWIHGSLFGETGVPIITKVKNLKKDTYSAGEYIGDIFSADVQIRFCTNCQ